MKNIFKYLIFLTVVIFCVVPIFSESDDEEENDRYNYVIESVVYPKAKRPKKISNDDKMASSLRNSSNTSNEYFKKCQDTFKFGLEAEIISLIDELTKYEDLRFVDEIYDLFQVTKNLTIREKIISYFTKLKDPCLEDYAVMIVDDPYDVKKDLVNACFLYISAVDCKAAIPCIVTILDKEEEEYFSNALTCLGNIARTQEAMYLADYLDRDDLSTNQRQSLMKVLGKIKAVETWPKLSEIAQDNDENSFVRMYAAEAIGAMEKPESEPILIRLYETDDANLRCYVVKGISHFKDADADNLILQALRDNQWKVRLEAVNAVESRELKAAVPYLVYRCKDSAEENNIKTKCYSVIAKLNVDEGNEYLVSIIKDIKVADTRKAQVAGALLEYNHAGTKEIIALAEQTLTKDVQKNLRYALGKEFAKWGRPEYEEICSKYLSSKDVSTQGTGLDIFAKGKYKGLRSQVEAIAKEAIDAEEAEKSAKTEEETKAAVAKVKKVNANAKKALKILQQIDSYN